MNEELIAELQKQINAMRQEIRGIEAEATKRIREIALKLDEAITQTIFLAMQDALTNQPEQE